MKQTIHTEADAESLAAYARDWLVKLIAMRHAASANARFSLALSGGSTPKRLYQLLSQLPAGSIDWQRVLLIWGDERNVPADHADSNFRMVKENLLDHIKIPAENVLAVPDPSGEPCVVAVQYEKLLRSHLEHSTLGNSASGFPKLDCVLLGMGEDVHTASLFPHTTALQETTRWVVGNHVPQLHTWRLTLTAPLINQAADIAFLLSGSGKRQALEKLWHAPYQPELYPSQLIRPTTGRLSFLVDGAAVEQVALPHDL
ncbi:MAG: 6-phosphogluconolactonase [Aureliella sp.]